MNDALTLAERLRRHWTAWGSPTDAEECVNEKLMAMDCKAAADEIERLAMCLSDGNTDAARLDWLKGTVGTEVSALLWDKGYRMPITTNLRTIIDACMKDERAPETEK